MQPGHIALALVVAGLAYAVWRLARGPRERPAAALPDAYHRLLLAHVDFYARLSRPERRHFGERVMGFLAAVRIEGAGFAPDDLDRVLVAASAQILRFRHAEARYPGLTEVVLQPDHFDEDWTASDPDEDMVGLVGEELLSGTVVLSRPALHESFAPDAELHVGLHEFAHLLDRADGYVDGCPRYYLAPRLRQRWPAIFDAELARVRDGGGYLDPYAGEDPGELFAVATEHYFLWPRELRRGHPQLYDLLRGLYESGK